MRRYSGPPVFPREDPLVVEMKWLDLRLVLVDYRLRALLETRMDAPVKNLAATVNEAVTALRGVPNVAAALKDAAVRVAGRVSQVQDLTNSLDAADAALALAVGGAIEQPTGNGGPPLDGGSVSSPAQPAPPPPSSPPAGPATTNDMSLKQSLKTVEAANA